MTRRLLFLIPAAVTVACSKPAPEPTPAPVASNLSDGCPTIVQEFLANPTTPVDRVAEPLKMDPPPIPHPVPAGVIKNGKAEVAVEVFVDTLGKADMKTFKVLIASHPYLANSVKKAVAKWKFRPAEMRGCKIPRTYKFEAHLPATGST